MVCINELQRNVTENFVKWWVNSKDFTGFSKGFFVFWF